ncbi:hypothetical protein H109_00001, partial [Trichophyton interdigitale MR816]
IKEENIKKLEKALENKALRKILEAFKTSSTYFIEIEALIPPIKNLDNRALLKVIKVSTKETPKNTKAPIVKANKKNKRSKRLYPSIRAPVVKEIEDTIKEIFTGEPAKVKDISKLHRVLLCYRLSAAQLR